MDQAAAYERIYERISALVDDDNAEVEVPTCDENGKPDVPRASLAVPDV